MPERIIPIKTRHALERCVLYFRIKKDLQLADIIAEESIGDYLNSGELCRLTGTEFAIKQVTGREACGFMLELAGLPQWTIVLKRCFLGIECLEYSSWTSFKEFVWPICKEFVVPHKEDFDNIGSIFCDRFNIAAGGEKVVNFPLELLFNKDSKFIVPAFFDALLPPVQSVWVEIQPLKMVSLNIPVRSQLSINAGVKENKLSFAVKHLQDLFLGKKNQELIAEEPINTALDKLHNNNKVFLSNILTEDALKKIGVDYVAE